MENSNLSIAGVWMGHFEYGPEYGEELYGAKVTFSLALHEVGDGQFEGKCIELDGPGMSEEISAIKGWVEGSYINFIKQYSAYSAIDENGNTTTVDEELKTLLTYTGEYDSKTRSFAGDWEIEVCVEPTPGIDLLDICTGSWKMTKSD